MGCSSSKAESQPVRYFSQHLSTFILLQKNEQNVLQICDNRNQSTNNNRCKTPTPWA